MMRIGSVLLILVLMAACNGKAKTEPATAAAEEDNGQFSYESFAGHFTAARLPYQLTDTALLRTDDTVTLRNPEFLKFLSDSLKTSLFGNGRVRFTPVARIDAGSNGSYFVVRGSAGERRAALLYIFDGKKKYQTVFPFLVPDDDDATAQAGSIERSGAITRSVTKKVKEQVAEGKEVYIYVPETKSFTLIMTDPLEDRQDILNPIDTFSRKNPLAGDYVKDARNFVSIRDARNPREIQFFVHFEKGEDDDKCVGELKGTAFFTSSKMAVYRQGGDPCVLELNFSGSSVTLRETEGCGSHRGVKCVFEGSFPRKKAVSSKTTGKKKGKG